VQPQRTQRNTESKEEFNHRGHRGHRGTQRVKKNLTTEGTEEHSDYSFLRVTPYISVFSVVYFFIIEEHGEA